MATKICGSVHGIYYKILKVFGYISNTYILLFDYSGFDSNFFYRTIVTTKQSNKILVI